ncbi:MAG TPA: hypothetical protein VFP32_00875 [Candidatus Saccharimonadales bacterium]|nr:hypothetical protein [Candidatus Saccharimonadales bacterium]
MNKFYCVANTDWPNRDDEITLELIKKACIANQIEYQLIDSKGFDFSDPPDIKPGSAMYRVATDPASSMVFRLLVRGDIGTVYQNQIVAMSQRITSALTHQKSGLPTIKTIFNLPTDRTLLEKYSDYLGGFPIIIKAVGGSHGIGVIRTDSFEALASLSDYLAAQKGQFIMRQYIDFKYHARLNVLGGKVIDSVIYEKPLKDFRTNVSGIVVTPHEFSNQTQRIATKAVQALYSDFGGVDILIDQQNNNFLAEVNIPCFFPRTQLVTGVDTAGMLVKFLIDKGQRLAAKQ